MDNNNLTPEENYYVQRYEFIHNELTRLQGDMVAIEEATAKLLKELQCLRDKETNRETEKDGEI